MWECLVKHAEVIRDLTLSASVVIAIVMGGRRLCLADKRDRREEEERAEQRKCRERKEREYWQKRFAKAVRQVLDETDKGTLSEARRIHALHDMAWIAENDRTGMFMAQAKDVVERFETIADAEWTLEVETGGMSPLAAPGTLKHLNREEELMLMAKTSGAVRDLHIAAAHYWKKWGGKPPDGGSDDGS